MRLKRVVLAVAIMGIAHTGCFDKNRVSSPQGESHAPVPSTGSITLDDIKKGLAAEGLELAPVAGPKREWILSGVKPSRFTVGGPGEKAANPEQVSLYVFQSEEARQMGLADFHKQAERYDMMVPRIYEAKNVMVFYWAHAANDKPSQYGAQFDAAMNKLKGIGLSDASSTTMWYVTKKEEQRALVVNQVPKDYGSSGGMNAFYDAVWVSNVPDEVQVGQKVKVKFEGEIAASYPGQGRAKGVSIQPSTKPDAAHMTEEQVLREAIASKETADLKVFVPTAISFDENAHLWTVRFLDGLISDAPIQIPDK